MTKEDEQSNTQAEQIAVFSSVKTSFIKKILNKFKKGSKRRLLWIVGAVLLLMTIATAIWLVLWYIVPYATVDGQQISRTQYDSMDSKMEQFYKYNKDKNVQKSAEKAAKDRLIEEKIIESEAKKRGITASAEEINERYQKIVSQYSSEAEYIKTIKAAYDWTPELTKQTIKIDILTEKLKKVVLKGYDVSYIFVRYDMISKTDDPNALPNIQKIYDQLQSGKKWEAVSAEIKSLEPLYTSVGSDEGVNSVTQLYPDPVEWLAISKLKSGGITEITKSNAGYYVIYHADKVNNGAYNTWQGFINDYKEKYVSYGYDYINKLVGFLYNNFIIQKADAIGVCDADICPRGGTSTQPYHPMIYAGLVYDANHGVSSPLNNVDVRLRPKTEGITNFSVQCGSTQINAVFDRTVQSVGTTDEMNAMWNDLEWGDNSVKPSAGINFHIGAKRDNVCGGHHIKNGPDCHIKWKVSFSKTGFISKTFSMGATTVAGDYNNGKITFDKVSLTPIITEWTLDGVTEVQETANRGDTVTFTHTITNHGEKNTIKVNSAIVWGDNPLYDVGSIAPGGDIDHPGVVILANGGTKIRYTNVTIPLDASGGQIFCQQTTFNNKTEDSDGSWEGGYSDQACVTVVVPPSWKLTPSVTVNPDAIEAGMPLNVMSTVKNEGPDGSIGTSWTLTRKINGVGEDFVGGLGVGFGTADYPVEDNNLGPSVTDTNTDSFSVGDQVCYTLYLSPRSSPASSPNVASASDCAIVGKKPKVQIWGGDLLVRGVSGLVTTSTSVKGGLTFGSWAEYGIIAGGKITGAASGAAFAGNGLASPKVAKYSTLSFSNSGNKEDCVLTNLDPNTIGCYKSEHSIPEVAASFPVTIPTNIFVSGRSLTPLLSGVYKGEGSSISIDGGHIKKGQWIVINAPNATITINKDIKYIDYEMHSISDLPQVVIIAKKIIINHDVTNVDAWLVANTNDVLNPGSIYTCDEEGKAISQCTEKLVVNGPVMTNKLYLRRTFGSGNGATSGEPAEVFNLRADAYLWAFNRASINGRIQTVYTTELPPRF